MRIAITRRRSIFALIGGLSLALVLVSAACGGDDDDDGAGDAAAGDTTSGATAEINMLTGAKFDRTELRVPAGEEVTITADNQDGSVPHNLSIYESGESFAAGDPPIVFTEICNAPCVRDLSVTLDTGSYYFICEVHPFMSGTLIAESAS